MPHLWRYIPVKQLKFNKGPHPDRRICEDAGQGMRSVNIARSDVAGLKKAASLIEQET
jgi:hypothetical protein